MLNAAETSWLLNKLCVDLGFCLPIEVRESFCANPPSDALGFTDAVIEAEGLRTELVERSLHRQTYAIVASFFRSRGYDVPETAPNNRRTRP